MFYIKNKLGKQKQKQDLLKLGYYQNKFGNFQNFLVFFFKPFKLKKYFQLHFFFFY